MALKFEATVTLGNTLSIAAVIISVGAAWVQLESRLTTLESSQNNTETVLKETRAEAAAERSKVRSLEVRESGTASDIRAIAASIIRMERKLGAITDR